MSQTFFFWFSCFTSLNLWQSNIPDFDMEKTATGQCNVIFKLYIISTLPWTIKIWNRKNLYDKRTNYMRLFSHKWLLVIYCSFLCDFHHQILTGGIKIHWNHTKNIFFCLRLYFDIFLPCKYFQPTRICFFHFQRVPTGKLLFNYEFYLNFQTSIKYMQTWTFLFESKSFSFGTEKKFSFFLFFDFVHFVRAIIIIYFFIGYKNCIFMLAHFCHDFLH